MKRLIFAGVSLCAFAGLSSSASANPRYHDGFQLQLTGGLGYYHASFDPDGTASDLTTSSSIMMGGTLKPGLVLGGGLFVDRAGSPTFEQGGVETEPDVTQFVVGIGPYVDYYLKPEGGLHFTGFLGWGGVETSSNGNAGGSDPTGLVVSAAAGYDMFISDEWSFGGQFRLAYGKFSLNDASYNTVAPAVLATFTWH